MDANSTSRLPPLPDEDLACLMNKRPRERYATAPYAYDEVGRLRSVYRHVILAKDEDGNCIMSEDQIKRATSQFAKTIKGLTEEQIRTQTPNTTRKQPQKRPNIITVSPRLKALDQIKSSTGTELSTFELANLANKTVWRRHHDAKLVWTSKGHLHPEYYALVLETNEGSPIMTRTQQALALKIEEEGLDLALSMIREAIRQVSTIGQVNVTAISAMIHTSNDTPGRGNKDVWTDEAERIHRLKAIRKTEFKKNMEYQRVERATKQQRLVNISKAYATKIDPETVLTMAPDELLFEEMTSIERFDIGHDDDGRILLRRDVIQPVIEKKGQPPRLQRMATIMTQGVLQAFLQLSLNETGCNSARGKTYFMGPLKDGKKFSMEQPADMAYLNEIWTSNEQEGFFELKPSQRMRFFAIECINPGKPVLPVQVIFAISTNTSKQIRTYARPLTSCILLFIDMIPHIMWRYEWEERCFENKKRDYKNRSRFYLTDQNVDWLKAKRVYGGEGVMKRLAQMSFYPPAEQIDAIYFAREVLLGKPSGLSKQKPTSLTKIAADMSFTARVAGMPVAEAPRLISPVQSFDARGISLEVDTPGSQLLLPVFSKDANDKLGDPVMFQAATPLHLEEERQTLRPSTEDHLENVSYGQGRHWSDNSGTVKHGITNEFQHRVEQLKYHSHDEADDVSTILSSRRHPPPTSSFFEAHEQHQNARIQRDDLHMSIMKENEELRNENRNLRVEVSTLHKELEFRKMQLSQIMQDNQDNNRLRQNLAHGFDPPNASWTSRERQ